jgi:hypothetical protein
MCNKPQYSLFYDVEALPANATEPSGLLGDYLNYALCFHRLDYLSKLNRVELSFKPSSLSSFTTLLSEFIL